MLSFMSLVALAGLLAPLPVAAQDAFECRSGVGWTKETMDKHDPGKVNLNVFYTTRFYDLSWNCADASYPVSVFWVAGRRNSVRYNTTNYFSVHNTTNASSGTFRFDPHSITRNDSPSPPRNSNMTGDEILGLSMNDINYLVIAQPDRPGFGAMMHILPAFVLLPPQAQQLFIAEYSAGRKMERKRWTIGVAVAVPIGVLLVGASCFWMGKRTKARGRDGKGAVWRYRRPILGAH
ncbi:hypothetical protein QBC39DRAFT_349785 [Podospora conica]|nr:hypothetical protein QBC39DRAFT_349785 [Schizothecium conicum]